MSIAIWSAGVPPASTSWSAGVPPTTADNLHDAVQTEGNRKKNYNTAQ
jgi:hypothetical protein